jgi:CubicO group peptidase (beta-lactamase class C family)
MRPSVRVSVAAVLLFVGNSLSSAAPSKRDDTPAADADVYLSGELSAKRIPGMSICVVHNGRIELAKGYGFANLELSVPASERTVCELASLTKPFTATAVMMLVEAGKISLEDRLPKYSLQFPRVGRTSLWGIYSPTHRASVTCL